MLGMTFDQLAMEPDQRKARDLIGRANAGEALAATEQTLTRKDGAPVAVELLLFRIGARGGATLLAICRDISERKRQEEEIQRLVQRFVVLNEISASLAMIRDSARLCELLCRNVTPLIPFDEFRIYLYDSEAETLTPIFVKRATGEEPSSEPGPPRPIDDFGVERLVARDNRYILLGDEQDRAALGLPPIPADTAAAGAPEVSVLVAPMTLGAQITGLIRVASRQPKAYSLFHLELLCNIAGIAGLAMRNAQLFEKVTTTLRQVKDSEALLSSLVSQSPIALWVGRLDGTPLLVNKPAAAMFVSPWSESGPPAVNLQDDEQFALQGVRGDLARVGRGEIVQHELVREGKKGPLRYRTTLFPLRDAQGAVVNAVAMFEDITATSALEARLRDAQKMEAIGTLAGGIAHDFNNLLTGILGYASFMLESLKPHDKFHREITLIEQSALRAAELTRQLLAFSRKSAMQKRPLSLNTVVADTERILQRSLRHEIDVRLDLDEDLYKVEADASQMQQALLNLCVNSRDAMPRGGLITIETRNEFLSLAAAGKIADASPGAYARLSVRDTGEGIAPENLSRVFDPFFTTKPVGQGTGLGLAMVYGAVQSLGGFITVESEVGKGAKFNLWIPSCETVDAIPTPPPSQATPVFGNETILVVDDEPHILQLASACLPPHGYRVITADSGQKAINIHRASRGQISLVLLDLLMPGMDGRETWREIRKLHAGAKVLFTSGYASEDLILSDDVKGYNFLRKPYSVEDLLRAIRKTLDGQMLRLY